MRKFAMIGVALLSAATMSMATAQPSFAQRSGYYDKHHVWHSNNRNAVSRAKAQCERDRQRASNKGAVVGGIGGALAGSAVAGRGAKTEGGVLGAVGGVLVGRQIAKKDHRC